jgi:hypothetical protein
LILSLEESDGFSAVFVSVATLADGAAGVAAGAAAGVAA